MIKEKISVLLKDISGIQFIDDNESLIKSGVLDSFSVMIFVSRLESEFNLKIQLKNHDLNDLDTINKIENFIKKNKI
tara:strand:- start:598 stop:828 length:231 start_codon:yes stop_codon:yes gene_type:complete